MNVVLKCDWVVSERWGGGIGGGGGRGRGGDVREKDVPPGARLASTVRDDTFGVPRSLPEVATGANSR